MTPVTAEKILEQKDTKLTKGTVTGQTRSGSFDEGVPKRELGNENWVSVLQSVT
jgi:hypothetical protein